MEQLREMYIVKALSINATSIQVSTYPLLRIIYAKD